MAKNLVRAGFTLRVYNRSAGRAERLLELGARGRGVAARGRVRRRRRDHHAHRRRSRRTGAVRSRRRGGRAMLRASSSSTCRPPDPRRPRDVAAGCPRSVRASSMRRCPGSRLPAEAAELVVLAGGDASDLAELEPVFSALARRVIHAGPVGAGQTLKVVLNGLGCQHLLAFASMLRSGERAGLAREVLVEAFTAGAFATPAYIAKRAACSPAATAIRTSCSSWCCATRSCATSCSASSECRCRLTRPRTRRCGARCSRVSAPTICSASNACTTRRKAARRVKIDEHAHRATLNIWNKSGPWLERLPLIRERARDAGARSARPAGSAADERAGGARPKVRSTPTRRRRSPTGSATGSPTARPMNFGSGLAFGNAVLSRHPILDAGQLLAARRRKRRNAGAAATR